MKKILLAILVLAVLIPIVVFVASRQDTTITVTAGFGPKPFLSAPSPRFIPTVNNAPAIGRPADVTPVAAKGSCVNEYASGCDHLRWLYVLPNGDVWLPKAKSRQNPTHRSASEVG